MKLLVIITILLLIPLALAQEEVGVIGECEDCVCENSECVLCKTPGENNQASYAVFDYEQYDIEDCTKCRILEEGAGIYPVDEEFSGSGVRYADGQGHYIDASCSEKFIYKLPLEGTVYFTGDEFGFQSSTCAEPPTREIVECGSYKKEVFCDTSGGFFDPEWHTLVAIRVPQADQCVVPGEEIEQEQEGGGEEEIGDGESEEIEEHDRAGEELDSEQEEQEVNRTGAILFVILILGAVAGIVTLILRALGRRSAVPA